MQSRNLCLAALETASLCSRHNCIHAFVLYHRGPDFRSPSSGLTPFWQADSDLRPRSHQGPALKHSHTFLLSARQFKTCLTHTGRFRFFWRSMELKPLFLQEWSWFLQNPQILPCLIVWGVFNTAYSLKPKTCGTCVLALYSPEVVQKHLNCQRQCCVEAVPLCYGWTLPLH